jgi:hypothetical protein
LECNDDALDMVDNDARLLWLVAVAVCAGVTEKQSLLGRPNIAEMYLDTLRFGMVGALLQNKLDADTFFAKLDGLLNKVRAASIKAIEE